MRCHELIFDEAEIKRTLEGLRDILTVINNRLTQPDDWCPKHIEEIQAVSHKIIDTRAAIWQMLQP